MMKKLFNFLLKKWAFSLTFYLFSYIKCYNKYREINKLYSVGDKMKMKIKIRRNAADIYRNENTDLSGVYIGDPVWEDRLQKISGKTLEVDTETLFKYEFNTKPIKGVSKEGIRIPEEYVEEVIDDVRKGKAYCELCNQTSNSDKVCTNCGKTDYLEAFFDDDDYES